MPTGRHVLSTAAACLAIVPLVLAVHVHAAGADIDECEDSTADWCLDQGDTSTPAQSPGENAGGGSGETDECGWVTIPAERIPGENESRPAIFTNGRAPDGLAVTWQGWCYQESVGGAFRGPYRWLPATDPVPTPTIEDIAQDAYDRLLGRLPEPSVSTSPPVGEDAILDVPVFVTVTNWQTSLVEAGTLLGDTVTVTATPQLMLDPAEPGSSATACAGPGRTYDPAGGDLWAQAAAPDACAYAYQRRTDVDGRPDAWPSTVTVRWTIAWAATSGESGAFPVVEQSVAVPRGVSEVQAVLVEEGR